MQAVRLLPRFPPLISTFNAPSHRLAALTLSNQADQNRSYRRHTFDTLNHSTGQGRSVRVTAVNPTQAYFKLRDIIQESRLNELVRSQERFERNTDKRRRKRKEKEWRTYMRHVKKQVQIAFDLQNRTKIEKETYKDI
ncbi:hypothetical protein SpCBS45565_g00188 [Spizellomyces sp. 'palustris']|nr:hypothetical protein SpCBS45565_g00188 [Spizellomyces sp. 'palustris']